MRRPRLNYGMLAGRLGAALLLLAAWLQPKPAEPLRLAHIVDDPTMANDIVESVESALRTTSPRSTSAVVIESDGYWPASIEPLLSMAESADVPILWRHPTSDDHDVRVARVSVPDYLRPSQPIAVSVTPIVPDGSDLDIVVVANGIRSEPVAASSRQPAFAIIDGGFDTDVSIDVELRDRLTGELVTRSSNVAIVNVVAAPRILLVTAGESPVGVSLRRGGWPVTVVPPSQLDALSPSFDEFSLIILDDVAARAAVDATWERLSASVRERATGLLVLGGPHSFALGAYRESTLEPLLPVVSEPPESIEPAAVVFVVDVSGSMDRGDRVAFDAARLAVLETAAGLRPTDRIGLVAFDIEAERLLPVAARNDHRDALLGAWPQSAGGGTRLQPALDLALDELAKDAAEQKLLVLLTDGRLSAEDTGELTRQFGGGDVDGLALLVGDAAATRVPDASNLDVISIDDVLRLPSLMRSSVDARRAPVVWQRTIPVPAAESGLPAGAWPALDAYALTRPQGNASVLLASPGGDPLYARWNAGAGRVAALTGGLGAWAADWRDSDQWPDFLGSVVAGLAVREASHVRIEGIQGDNVAIAVEEITTAPPTNATLILPDGTAQDLSFVQTAPGQFGTATRLPLPGVYTLSWDEGNGRQRHRFSRTQVMHAALPLRRTADDYIDAGLVLPWSEALRDRLTSGQQRKTWLTALALLVFLVTVAVERLPISAWRASEAITQRKPRAA